ncbi:MAG: hypothetical protein ACLUVV_02875 [Christensenellales bacterium]
MLDAKFIRQNPEFVKTAVQNRNGDPAVIDELMAVDAQRRAAISQSEAMQASRNRLSNFMPLLQQLKKPTEMRTRWPRPRGVCRRFARSLRRIRRRAPLRHCFRRRCKRLRRACWQGTHLRA